MPKRPENPESVSAFIRKYPKLSPAEVYRLATERGLKLSNSLVSVVRRTDARKATKATKPTGVKTVAVAASNGHVHAPSKETTEVLRRFGERDELDWANEKLSLEKAAATSDNPLREYVAREQSRLVALSRVASALEGLEAKEVGWILERIAGAYAVPKPVLTLDLGLAE